MERGFIISIAIAVIGCGPLQAESGAPEQPGATPWNFSNETSVIGLDYTHYYNTTNFNKEHHHISGGLAIGDLNGDGWDDIFAVTGYTGNADGTAPNSTPNKLFIANGDGTFTEDAGSWIPGLTDDKFSAGPLITDFNGDGYNDLAVGGVEGYTIKLYQNTGIDTFIDGTVASGLSPLFATSLNFGMAAGDIDQDGDLDLFVTHWVNNLKRFLMQNNGSGVFTDVTTAKMGPGLVWGTFTPAFVDINADGWVDLLIASDFLNADSNGGGSRYFLNTGTGAFTAQGHPVPIDPDPINGPDQNGMGSAIADYDNDGDLDWFVTSIYDTDGVSEANWGVTGNRLYQNDGAGQFTDVTEAAGVRNGYWGWGACFADFNNDMHLDLFHVNGFRPGGFSPTGPETEFENDPARMFISNGDGTFSEQAVALGVADTPYGRAILCFDNDRDGDLDILVNNNNNTSRYFRNNLDNGNHYIEIKLKQDSPNFEAIGAKISLTAGGITQIRQVMAGGNFESSHPTALHFGLGTNTSVTNITVTWPDGDESVYTDETADQYLTLTKAPDPDPIISLKGLEVVQVVQDWNNSASLAAHKPTVVRAHLDHDSGPVTAHFTFRLYGFDASDQPLDPAFIENGKLPSGLPGGGELLTLPVTIDTESRSLEAQSARFYLPLNWTGEGVRKFVFEAPSLPAATCGDQAPPIHGDCAVSIEFSAQKQLTIHMIRTQFAQTGGSLFTTGESDLAPICDEIRKRFPTSTVTCPVDSNPIVFPSSTTFPTSDDIVQEVNYRKWLSAGCWWGGCEDFYLAVTKFPACDTAACAEPSISGQANFPSSYVPWSRSAWSVDSSLDPEAATHELGHTLDLQHTTTQDLEVNDGEKNGTCGAPPHERAAEDVLYPPLNSFYFPYYIGDLPLREPRIGPSGNDQEIVFGYDTDIDAVIPNTAQAIMSHCGSPAIRWPDIGSYNFLFQTLAAVESPGANVQAPLGNPTQYYFLSGTVDLQADTAIFDPVEILVPQFVPPTPPVGDWELVAHFNAAPDLSYPLGLSTSPNAPNLADFFAFVEFDAEITGFTLQRENVPLGQLTRSNNVPQISITGPAPGTVYRNEDMTLEWDALDTGGDQLTFRIEYSPDGGVSWVNLSSNWPGSPFTINSGLLEQSLGALLRVTARDGFNSASDTLQGTIQINPPDLIHLDGFEQQ